MIQLPQLREVHNIRFEVVICGKYTREASSRNAAPFATCLEPVEPGVVDIAFSAGELHDLDLVDGGIGAAKLLFSLIGAQLFV